MGRAVHVPGVLLRHDPGGAGELRGDDRGDHLTVVPARGVRDYPGQEGGGG